MSIGFPSDRELLDAVSEFLEQEVLPAVTDEVLAYRLKVAVNSLGIVARQCERGPALDDLAQNCLSALLDEPVADPNAGVAQALREGSLDATAPEVLDALKQITLAKMAIDNPKYSTYRALRR